jgi:GxxExxY protein
VAIQERKADMAEKAKSGVIQGEPWLGITYKVIGLAMEVHNEIGPGHREAVYHDAMAAKFKLNGVVFEDEPHVLVALEDGTLVGGNSPDFVIEERVIVELKSHTYDTTSDEEAQVIGYFAALSACPVALLMNFGRRRLEYHRLLPPKSVQAYQRPKWSK